MGCGGSAEARPWSEEIRIEEYDDKFFEGYKLAADGADGVFVNVLFKADSKWRNDVEEHEE